MSKLQFLIFMILLSITTMVYAESSYSKLIHQPPTISEVVAIPYQVAHRNISKRLRLCIADIVNGTIYINEQFADLFIWSTYPSVALLSYIEIQAIDASSSKIVAWHVKPVFGEGFTEYAKSAPILAISGANPDCKALGF